MKFVQTWVSLFAWAAIVGLGIRWGMAYGIASFTAFNLAWREIGFILAGGLGLCMMELERHEKIGLMLISMALSVSGFFGVF